MTVPSEDENKKKDFKEMVLKEYEKGNVVFMTCEGVATAPLKKFVEQPVEGLLYDLNRDEATVLTLIGDPKWVNDFAVAKVIRELKRQIDELREAKR